MTLYNHTFTEFHCLILETSYSKRKLPILLSTINKLTSIFRWEFKTIDHDIRFGIKMVNDQTGEENVEIPLHRVASHELDEEGLIHCQKDCTCNETFRNN